MDILLDRVDILGVLLGGVGVVHAQVADAAEALGRGEVDGQGLAVADVQIAVRLGREARMHLHAVAAIALLQVFLHKFFDKVSGLVHLLVLLFVNSLPLYTITVVITIKMCYTIREKGVNT